MEKSKFAGMKILIAGLGVNGGGVEATRYLAKKGAEITITDKDNEIKLARSIEKLKEYPIRYVLGKHEMDDFKNADMVIKNPGVPRDSPFLEVARHIETDISLFLAANPARILAVTGSKGKSSVSSALYRALGENRNGKAGKVWLGGNITLSPLAFLDELKEGDDVVLELSNFQLGDLGGRNTLKPRAAVITPIMRDHLNKYSSMEDYVADKRLIGQNQNREDLIVTGDDEWGAGFRRESRGRPLVYFRKPPEKGIPGGWFSGPDFGGPGFARLEENGAVAEIVPERLLVPGVHQKQNLLAAGLALLDLGLEADFIRESLGHFSGIEHRLEFFLESGGVRFYNDSAATIPEAAAAAINAFEKAPVLVAGGSDKSLDFTPLARAAAKAKAVILLEGSGSDKLKNLLDSGGVKYRGPFDSLEAAIKAVSEIVIPGDTVTLSPGCTSYGKLFHDEFDRGRQWKEGVRKFFA